MDEAAENLAHEAPLGLGATFAAERERQGLSRAEVAHRLHMSPFQIEAIEVDDYGRLPKGTFLRGFVRNYAKVLGLAPQPLLDMLAGTAPAMPSPGIVVPTQNIRFDPLGERLSSPYVKAATLALVAVVIGFAAMYWVMFVRPRPPALGLRGAMQPPAPHQSASSMPPPAAPRPAAPAVDADGAAKGASTPPAGTPALPPPAASAPAAGAGATPKAGSPEAAGDGAAKPASADNAAASRRIGLHFTGDSWVEVRDADGKVLFQKLNAAGSDAQVSGRPPLEVVVGNAPDVRMTLDGKPFDLEPHTKVAVARFTLE